MNRMYDNPPDYRSTRDMFAPSEQLFREMADAMPQMIWVSRPDGYHEYYNRRWYEFTGVPEGYTDGIDETWRGIFHPEDIARSNELWAACLCTGNSYEIEYRLRRADGEYRWVLSRASAHYDCDGNIVKWYGTCTDIQDLVDARLKAEQANQAKTEFLANMSHEIRTPMNAIVGLSAILARQDLPDKHRQYVHSLQTSANALLGLINDLLDIAKVEADSIELEMLPVPLAELVAEIDHMLGESVAQKGLTFTRDVAAIEGKTYFGDPTRIRQILLNLCGNAIKFTDRGGVDIRVGITPGPDSKPDIVTFVVRDSGIGIDEKKLPHIFEKFVQADSSYTRKYGGTGLGLSISKALAELMGGSLGVKSTPHVGSEFTLRLPMSRAVAIAHHASELPVAAISRNKGDRILLVEDQPANILVATTLLEEFGFLYEVAHNAAEAFDAMTNRKFDLVLMDVQMPGKSGLEVTRDIRAYEKLKGMPRLKIIGMTAHALLGDREYCLEAGMDDYISKPFHANYLKAKLDEALS